MIYHVGPIIIATIVKRRQKLMEEIKSVICGHCITTYGYGLCNHGKTEGCALFEVTKLIDDMWQEDAAEQDALDDVDQDPDWEREND